MPARKDHLNHKEKKMYNKQQKEDYIAYEGKTNDGANRMGIENYFVRISKFEEQYQKDIADMNYDELKSTITEQRIRLQESRSHFISLIRQYIHWAMLYGKTTNKSEIDSIGADNISALDAIRVSMLQSPEQLQHILDTNEARDNELSGGFPNRHNRDSLILWLLYLGFRIEDLQTLEKKSMDENGVITTFTKEKRNDKNSKIIEVTYQATDKIRFLWDKCVHMDILEKSAKGGNGTLEYKLCDNDYLFRQIKGKKEGEEERQKCPVTLFVGVVVATFQKYRDATGIKGFLVSPLYIRLSGFFWSIYEQEKNNIKISLEIIANILKIDYNNEAELYSRCKKWQTLYDDWKIAFGHGQVRELK